MRILLFSTNANNFNPASMHKISRPECAFDIENLCKTHNEHKFIIATQFPGTFLIDYNGHEIKKKALNAEYHLIPEELKTPEKIAVFLKKLTIDFAIPFSFWDPPYDWHCVLDSMIAENLENMGIKCHFIKSNISFMCFDKEKTRNFLSKNGFLIPEGFFINRDLFIADKSIPSMKINVYKEYIFSIVEKINYPVVVKESCGLSSFNVDVIKSKEALKNHLNSKKMKGNRIVERYIDGIQAGIVIYSNKKNITVQSPFFFSVNQYGITSPKQSIKAGPVIGNHNEKKFNIPELKKEMERLAKLTGIQGCIQVDLVFDGKKWYIIEINPRISGMSAISALSYSKSVSSLIVENALTEFYEKPVEKDFLLLDIKTIPISEKLLDSIYAQKYVYFACTTKNDEAKQHRECGYTQIIIKGKDCFELKQNLQKLKAKFYDLIEETFYNKALKLINLIEND